MGKSENFSITSGVRQVRVFSQRFFAVPPWVLRQRGLEIGNAIFDFGDILSNLVDLHFADDILVFGHSGFETAQTLVKFGEARGSCEFAMNADKTVIWTKEAQPRDGLILKVLDQNHKRKSLGCILTACGNTMQHVDLLTTWNKVRQIRTLPPG